MPATGALVFLLSGCYASPSCNSLLQDPGATTAVTSPAGPTAPRGARCTGTWRLSLPWPRIRNFEILALGSAGQSWSGGVRSRRLWRAYVPGLDGGARALPGLWRLKASSVSWTTVPSSCSGARVRGTVDGARVTAPEWSAPSLARSPLRGRRGLVIGSASKASSVERLDADLPRPHSCMGRPHSR